MKNKFYSKNEREFLRHLNARLGTNHREIPYDFNNMNDLKEYTVLLISSYMDYRKYWMISDSLYEELDESIEIYTPLTWAAMTEDDISGDELILETISALAVVENNLSELYMRIEKELKDWLEIIMHRSDEVQRFIWNDVYHFDEILLEELFKELIEAPYTYSIDESFALFCNLIKNLDDEKKSKNSSCNDSPILLHLELLNEWCDDEEKQLLMKYADTTKKGTIIRDVLIPADMPLHNLHYAIQRLFGWQNSHLRSFRLDEKDYKRLTGGRVKEWSTLVGELFRGLPNDENDQFWDDDYIDGNFKIWLRKKYTGPYEYGGYTENYDVAKGSIEQLFNRFPEIEVKESFGEYYKRIKGKKDNEKEPMKILRKVPILDLTIHELLNSIFFDSLLDELLERIEVAKILGIKDESLADYEEIIKRGIDKNAVRPVTDKLIYNYDFGDNWCVEITRYSDYEALLKQGTVEEDWLREAVNIVRDKHKPVCVNKKGGFVMDDVGGMSGFADFIDIIYKGKDVEERKSSRQWAESMGWSNKKVELKKML